MKKILLAMLCALGTLTASAQKEYTENLTVTANNVATEIGPTTVTVKDNGDGTYDFSLNNFYMLIGDDAMFVGNIRIDAVQATQDGNITHLRAERIITIQPGEYVEYDGEIIPIPEDAWVGPMLGELPINFTADITDDSIYAYIYLDLTDTLGQIVEVKLGDPLENAIALVRGTTTDTIHTIGGISLDRASQAGLYIINGKKAIIK